MRFNRIIAVVLFVLSTTGFVFGQSSQKPLTLEECIKIALEKSLPLYSDIEGIAASEFRRKAGYTDFFPKWSGQYGYSRSNQPILSQNISGQSQNGNPVIFGKESKDAFNFTTGISQPLFTGGALTANYRIDKIGVDISRVTAEVTKRDIVLQVRDGYFTILNNIKLQEVAEQAVKQFEAQLEVTKAFFEVGIVPKNDLLQAEVRLANAKQLLIRAENSVAVAKSSFNTLLRRGINDPLEIVDILDYKPFALVFEACLQEAIRDRPEIRNAELSIMQAKEAVKVARSGFFPTVNLTANYSRSSAEAALNGDLMTERWSYQTLATITFWEWGKTGYQVGESKVRVTQAEIAKTQLIEGITFEVKNAFLAVAVAEKNIRVAEKSIEQAEENVRMNEERYKYQVATQTDVLDAVTLLAQARVNYYGALSDFNIAKATLERAMGRMYP
jgi:outer membrane protein